MQTHGYTLKVSWVVMTSMLGYKLYFSRGHIYLNFLLSRIRAALLRFCCSCAPWTVCGVNIFFSFSLLSYIVFAVSILCSCAWEYACFSFWCFPFTTGRRMTLLHFPPLPVLPSFLVSFFLFLFFPLRTVARFLLTKMHPLAK